MAKPNLMLLYEPTVVLSPLEVGLVADIIRNTKQIYLGG
jgi:ABC-type branched-subunit amino acid transport system ATPase component